MNELIGPLLFAAIFSAGDGLQSRADTAPAGQRPAQAPVLAANYRLVEATGEVRRGERLPARYQAHDYVIEDWRKLRLSKPPNGHQWVRAGDAYALVAIATGKVTQVVQGR